MKFNLNQRAKFTVKESGVAIWEAYSGNTVKAGDLIETQLWLIMSVFGPHLNVGINNPIEMEIELEISLTEIQQKIQAMIMER